MNCKCVWIVQKNICVTVLHWYKQFVERKRLLKNILSIHESHKDPQGSPSIENKVPFKESLFTQWLYLQRFQAAISAIQVQVLSKWMGESWNLEKLHAELIINYMNCPKNAFPYAQIELEKLIFFLAGPANAHVQS